jgi:hypothetical protein
MGEGRGGGDDEAENQRLREELVTPSPSMGEGQGAGDDEAENRRLREELRQALAREAAIAEVLQVINSSPGDLAPVFDAILEKAHILCGAAKGSLVTIDGPYFRTVATRGLSEQYAAILRQAPHNPPSGSIPDRLLKGESVVHLADARDSEFPIPRALPSWRASEQFYMYRSEKIERSSATSPPTAKQSSRSPTKRSRCCRTSPRRRSLRWRMHGY